MSQPIEVIDVTNVEPLDRIGLYLRRRAELLSQGRTCEIEALRDAIGILTPPVVRA